MAWLFLFVWHTAVVHGLEIKIKLAKHFYFYLFIQVILKKKKNQI